MKLENYIEDMERLSFYLEQKQNCGKLTHEQTVDTAIELMDECEKGLIEIAKRLT